MPTADLAITDVTVVDVRHGTTIPGQTVLVEGDRIVSVGPAARTDVPAGARAIDGAGRYLIPGLWDMHVHAWSPQPFSRYFLDNGITAVREMGTGTDPQFGGSEGVWSWRAAVREGRMPGPRVFAPGFILNGGAEQRSVFFKSVVDADDANIWVDSLASAEADFVKVYTALSPEAFAAIAERARTHGLTLAGHVSPLVGTRAAVRDGLRSIEHMTDLLVATSSEEDEIRGRVRAQVAAQDVPSPDAPLDEAAEIDRLVATHDPDKAAELFGLFREQGTWIAPTLAVISDPRCPGSVVSPPDSAALADLGFIARFVQVRDFTETELDQRCRRYDQLREMVPELEEAGVPMLVASDAPNPGVLPGVGLHDEMSMLVHAGLTPARVLRMATLDAAEFMGVSESLGTIEEGKLADLVLLDADPAADIRNTRGIAAVVAGGQVVREPG